MSESFTAECCATAFTADTVAEAQAMHERYHNDQFERGTRAERVSQTDVQEMARLIEATAVLPERYERGWDVIAECWSREGIVERLTRTGAQTPAEALAVFAELADIWDDRQQAAKQAGGER